VPAFLLEIRTEEIPAKTLAATRGQLEQGLKAQLTEAGFVSAQVGAYSTSRRLVLLVRDLPERQADREETVTGPPRSAAFAADGTPTRAAEGFARKVGLTVNKLHWVTTAKGEYLAATVLHQGRPTTEILAEAVTAVVESLRFPKMMRWGLGQHLFVRPVHGVVALLDEEVVPLQLFGVASDRVTLGHRVHAPEPFKVTSVDSYLGQLSERGVTVDQDERRQVLAGRASTLASEVGCEVIPDPELMGEHVELVEHPELLRGEIDPRFLELPREVVVTTLRHHQKCLALTAAGKLASHFLAVIDRADDPQGLIRQGNEWVIGARLADARFFFSSDRKHPFEDLVPKLERLEFHRRLGSVAAKAWRVGELGAWLASAVATGIDPELLRRTAPLVKADLSSHMVGEFPELQGVMGGHYLRLEGAPDEVWQAARDHYRPQGFEGDIPASDLGRVLAAADRLDTLVGLFAVGEVPSGSRDPFGLRRAAQGVVRIAAEAGWDVDLSEAVPVAVALLDEELRADAGAVAEAVTSFLADRVRRYLVDVEQASGDTAEAVMVAGRPTVPDQVARARALEAVRALPTFRSLALAFKRVRNITEGAPVVVVDPALLVEDEERELHRAAGEFRARLDEVLPRREVEEGFRAMEPIAGILDRFFDEVLVMTDDARVRDNRIALLSALRRDFLTLADLSKLQVEGG